MVAVSLPASSPILPSPLHLPSCCSTTSRSQCQLLFPSTRIPLRVPPGSTTGRRLKVVRAVEADKGEAATSGDQGGFSILNLPDWAKWVLGASVWLSLPLVNKLRDVGNLVARVDSVVEKVEEVAERADKIAEDLAEDLPDGALKDLAIKVEKTSEVVISRAKAIDNVLDKMSDIVDDMMEAGSKTGGASSAAKPAGTHDRKGGASAAGSTAGARPVAASSSASPEDKEKQRGSS